MNNKYLTAAFGAMAIAIAAVPVNAEERANLQFSESAFVCSVQGETPTMFAYNPGEVALTPLMRWHGEYVAPSQSGAEICQQTAVRLQDSYQQDEAKYLKSATTEEENIVCLVNDIEGDCADEDSQKLFSVNPKYNASCVLENKTPIECAATQVRRGIYSFNDEPYQPLWWPW
ncbi:MAG: COP23 domain-containing protein [Cyanobacteria bacterium J06623_7]